MSRIAFNGNALGTGTVTIASPNTNSDQTLTLPDSTGTVLLNGGAASFSTLTVNSNNISAVNSMGFRNRIINGDMRISQRAAGASVTEGFAVDRFEFQENGSAAFTIQRSTTVPTGFVNSTVVTVTSAASATAAQVNRYFQRIEGNNIADLGFGTATASTVTLSFWVRSSLTGTYCAALVNNAANRSYVAEYSISAANTWEYKTITIAGDTTGTWETGTSSGVQVTFDLGSGSDYNATAGSWVAANDFRTTNQANFANTSGATFYITGVQLEAGSVASPFERRDYGRELIMCQRYYAKLSASSAYAAFGSGALTSSTNTDIYIKYPVSMRSAPTFSYGGTLGLSRAGSYYNVTGSSSTYAGTDSMMQQIQASSLSGTAGQGCVLLANGDATCFIALSAEL